PHTPGAHAAGEGDAPVDAAVALVEPGAEQAGEKEREEGGRRRLVDAQPSIEGEKGDHQDAADAHRADEQADQRGHACEKEVGDQPAAKATSSLVSSTASL